MFIELRHMFYGVKTSWRNWHVLELTTVRKAWDIRQPGVGTRGVLPSKRRPLDILYIVDILKGNFNF